eukprot:CAMPEP_0114667128 /NCGR_PEP_ID=MMETSP0191-20121206/33817_1 /TAXON_ID=126664 /ORGANISM="Sorites sp." /LENGTH=68 /DNA_ID=CAMNT_0001916599 /DNA_START=25 /DNA_END=227 /DNA_ORIENTATION=+
MVREIIHLQVGQCGNQIGNAFWETVAVEHALDKDGKYMRDKASKTKEVLDETDKIDVYFKEASASRYV